MTSWQLVDVRLNHPGADTSQPRPVGINRRSTKPAASWSTHLGGLVSPVVGSTREGEGWWWAPL